MYEELDEIRDLVIKTANQEECYKIMEYLTLSDNLLCGGLPVGDRNIIALQTGCVGCKHLMPTKNVNKEDGVNMNGNTFKVGDYAFFTMTPSQLKKPGIVCEVTPYKITQVVTKLIGSTVYNTKHGSAIDYHNQETKK